MTIPVQKKASASPVFLRAAAKVVFVLMLGVIEVSCGDTYRPVAQVIPQPPPNPAAFHFVISVSSNGAFDPGAASRIDVSGDSTAGVFQTGVAPAHAALIPNGTRLYVANSAEDTITENNTPTPTVATTISLPQPCPPPLVLPCAKPVFVHTTENAKVYVANFGTNSVSVINTMSNVVTANVQVGTHPVALAELPNAQKLYVANQGSGNVSVISTVDDSVKPQPIPVGSSSVWAVARSDNARVYVLDSSGAVYDIDTLSDTVKATGSSGGMGANFMLYDSTSNSLLVTNSGSGTLSVLDAAADPPSLRANSPIPIPAPAVANPCQGAPVVPSAVTILPDGRAYVASYQLSSGLVCTQSSVIDTAAGAVTKTIPLEQAADLSAQTGCGSAGFRVFTTSSGGGSTSNFKVYIAQCDAGNVAVIDTFPSGSNPQDTFNGVALAAPLSSFPAPPGSQIPPPQNPVLVVAGP
jgi:YVTN family beta-propeller protein